MSNITLSLNDQLVKQSRTYAEKHHTSLNGMIRSLLTKTVQTDNQVWLKECFSLMDKAQANSRGKKWQREDLHR